MAKKRAAKKNDALELLLKNAESDPEAYALLQSLKLSRESDSKPKKATKSVKAEEPPVKKGRPSKAQTPKEIRVNNNLKNKTKAPARTRRLEIGKNTFDPNQFKNQCRDKNDTILRKQNIITDSGRPQFEPIEVECAVCHRIEVVPPSYVTSDYYRCVNCSRA